MVVTDLPGVRTIKFQDQIGPWSSHDILRISLLDLQGKGVCVYISVAAKLSTHEDRMILLPISLAATQPTLKHLFVPHDNFLRFAILALHVIETSVLVFHSLLV